MSDDESDDFGLKKRGRDEEESEDSLNLMSSDDDEEEVKPVKKAVKKTKEEKPAKVVKGKENTAPKNASNTDTTKKKPAAAASSTTTKAKSSAKTSEPSAPTSSSSSSSAAPVTSSTGETDITRGADITTDASAKALLLKYFNQQNRPYSAIQLLENLHKRIQKATLERCLTGLCDPTLPQRLICKEYGKAKIYFPDQSAFPVLSAGDLNSLEEEVKGLEERVARDRERDKQLRAQIVALNAEPKDDELDE